MGYLPTKIKNTELPGAKQIKLFVNENGISDLEEIQHRVNVFLALRKDDMKVLDIKLTATESATGTKNWMIMVIYEVI